MSFSRSFWSLSGALATALSVDEQLEAAHEKNHANDSQQHDGNGGKFWTYLLRRLVSSHEIVKHAQRYRARSVEIEIRGCQRQDNRSHDVR